MNKESKHSAVMEMGQDDQLIIQRKAKVESTANDISGIVSFDNCWLRSKQRQNLMLLFAPCADGYYSSKGKGDNNALMH